MATTTATETKTLVNYRVEDGIAVIELCDPPANTYTYEMNRQLDECILKARMDNDVYVLLLTGAGDKFFSAGANIKMLAPAEKNLSPAPVSSSTYTSLSIRAFKMHSSSWRFIS